MKTEMTPATEEKLIAFVACAGSAAGKVVSPVSRGANARADA